MKPYQQDFIELALEHQVLCFGAFTLKSGRTSPYFFNAGKFSTGKALAVRTTAEWLDILGKTNVPHMVVHGLDDLVQDPHLVAIGFWQQMEHPSEGTIRMSKPPINFSKTKAAVRSLAPRLGEHTREVLAQAGYQGDELEGLLSSGAARDLQDDN